MKKKRSGFFWVSYSDLMTTLFFVMLVLFVVFYQVAKVQINDLATSAEKLERIKSVERALETLDTNYFYYDSKYKRYKLNIDANFKPDSANINSVQKKQREGLEKAGNELFKKIKSIISQDSSIYYLIIIEGNTQRVENSTIGKNWLTIPDVGYNLSYRRALSLFNFWQERGIDFSDIGNNQCEVIIAGSGYFGLSRESDEIKNRRFSIQITSKVGMFLDQ